ncbi:Cellulose synthase-like protein G3 [Vitis vinifera]|uniref:Cellulose synthase-like protein G3 n=1 Tax=Vitis vinifera TaxID=29760 RepID=A0A438J585_VITVI|nr:Cellulose synthase-like protein G3 [Vitis vinifera]
MLQLMYETMKIKVESVVEKGTIPHDHITNKQEKQAFSRWTDEFTQANHPAVVQRERPGSPHHFKAGALNVLIRVSATMTNAPVVLTLDSDMHSNDPQTPLRALCYLLDPDMDPNLGFVQFPQAFHGINKNDIYAGECIHVYQIHPIGMDGLAGPMHVGTGCFFRREVFSGGPSRTPGLSSDHLVSKSIGNKEVLASAHHVSAWNYENQTNWGTKMGYRYGSLCEDYCTGYRLHCEGWKSIFCNPKRPAFLGRAPINLNVCLNQSKRWGVGLLEVGFCKHSPIVFGLMEIGPLMGLCYANYAFRPLWSIPITIYAFLPPLALLKGVSIFPKVSEPRFFLYIFLFVGAYTQDCLDFLLSGATIQRWWSTQRVWMMRGVSSFAFSLVEYLLKCIGISQFGFNVTSKVVDREQSKRYKQGIFEFGVSSPLFLPLTTAAIMNLVSFLWGMVLIFKKKNLEGMLLQMLLAGFVMVNCWPIYEAMVLRTDRGRMPTRTTIISILLAWALTKLFLSVQKCDIIRSFVMY